MRSVIHAMAAFVGLGLLLATSACATVGGKSQAIAVDSEPRGLSVAIDSTPHGEDAQTPFAASVERKSKLNLTYHSDHFSKMQRVDCDVRYGTVLAGNVPLALLSTLFSSSPLLATVFYGVFVGADFATGAAYECPYLVHHSIDVPQSIEDELFESCKKVLMLPPKAVTDLSLSAALLDDGKSFAKRSNEECVEFVSPVTASDALRRSLLNDVGVKNLLAPEMGRQLAQLLRDTGAHQAVEIQPVRRTQKLHTVKFVLWDLYAGQVTSSFEKNLSNEKFETLKGGLGSWVLAQSIRLIPNSVALLGASPELIVQKEFVDQQRAIPGRSSLFGLLTATSVQHPDQFGTWGGDVSIGSSFYFDALRNEVNISVNKSEPIASGEAEVAEVQRKEFRGYALSVPFDITGSLHTPAGAFRLFVGYGLAGYLPTSSTATQSALKIYPVAHSGCDWLAYMSSNVFFQLGLHVFYSGSPIEKQGLVEMKGWSSGFLGVGYYFPGSQALVESIVTKK